MFSADEVQRLMFGDAQGVVGTTDLTCFILCQFLRKAQSHSVALYGKMTPIR